MQEYLEVVHIGSPGKQVRAFFSVKKSRTGEIGTLFSSNSSDITQEVWNDRLKSVVIGNIESLMDLTTDDPWTESIRLLPKNPEHKYELCFAYTGSHGRNPVARSFMFFVRHASQQHTAPAAAPQHDPC
jgi:hypothetical protein